MSLECGGFPSGRQRKLCEDDLQNHIILAVRGRHASVEPDIILVMYLEQECSV
jgi:hypothetical protein